MKHAEELVNHSHGPSETFPSVIIFEKYSSQFNLKYSGESEISSQGALDYEEKSEINVETKAPELIGQLACNLWIYCNGI